VERTAIILMNIHAARSETILKAVDVEVIRDAQQTAGWMGSSESDFCQTVVNRAQSRIWRRDFEPRAKRNELENSIRNVLGEPANN
jgi:hypothetical protein